MGFGKWSICVLIGAAATGVQALPVGDLISDAGYQLPAEDLAAEGSGAASVAAGPVLQLVTTGLKGKNTHEKPVVTERQVLLVSSQSESKSKPAKNKSKDALKDIVTLGDKHRHHYGMAFGDPDHRKPKGKGKGHVVPAPGAGHGHLPGGGPKPVPGGQAPDLTPVPLPAGFPLMALGLAALAFMRKRMLSR